MSSASVSSGTSNCLGTGFLIPLVVEHETISMQALWAACGARTSPPPDRDPLWVRASESGSRSFWCISKNIKVFDPSIISPTPTLRPTEGAIQSLFTGRFCGSSFKTIHTVDGWNGIWLELHVRFHDSLIWIIHCLTKKKCSHSHTLTFRWTECSFDCGTHSLWHCFRKLRQCIKIYDIS